MQWICVLVCLVHTVFLSAQQSQWAGGGTPQQEYMNQANNWTPASVPTSGTNFLLFPSGTNFLTPVNNIGMSYTLPSPTMSNPHSLEIDGGYTITGGNFVVPSSGALIFFNSSSLAQLNTGLTLNMGGVGQIFSAGSVTPKIGGSQITGAGGLLITGPIIFSYGSSSSPNNYTGTTELSNGATLYAGASGAFSSGSAVLLNPGSTLSLGVNPAGSFLCSIKSLEQSTVSINDTTVALGNGTLTILNNSSALTYPGQITATNGGLVLADGVTLTLSGNNSAFSTMTNPATVTVGQSSDTATLTMGGANALGSSAGGAYVNLKVYGTLFLDGNNLTATSLNGSGTVTLGGAALTITGGGNFTGIIGVPMSTEAGSLIVESGALVLSGANTYTGTTSIGNGGTLSLNNADAIAHSSGLIFTTGAAKLQLVDSSSFSQSVTLNTAATTTIDLKTSDLVFGGSVTGAGTLTVKATTNAQSLTLDGANGFTGQVAIDNATVISGSASGLGTNAPYLIKDGGILNINGQTNTIGSLAGGFSSEVQLSTGTPGSLTIHAGSVNDAFYGVISDTGAGAGNVTAGGGTVTFMGTNTYTGTTNIAGGATLNTYVLPASGTGLEFSGSGNGSIVFGSAVSSSVPLDIGTNATLSPNTFDVELSGDITGSSKPLFKLGPGKVTLSGELTAGAISSYQIQGGTLSVNSQALSPVGSQPSIIFNTNGGTLQLTEALTIPITQPLTLSGVPSKVDVSGNLVAIASPLSGGGNLIVLDSVGSGTLSLTNAGNTYNGTTSIYNGTLLAVSGAIPGGGGAETPTQLVFGGYGQPSSPTPNPIFQCAADITPFAPAIVLMSNGTIDTNGHAMNVTGVVAGLSNYTLTKTGAGTLTLGGASIYQGPTNIVTGTLKAGVASTSTTGAFGYLSAMTVGTGTTLDLNSLNNTVGTLAGAGTITSSGAAVLTVASGNSNTFTGAINGGASLSLSSGTFTMNGTSNSTGTTTIGSGATLLAGGSGVFSSGGTYSISSGGTFDLNGNSNTIGSLAGASGSTMIIGSNTLTISDGGGNTFSGAIPAGSGALTLSSGTVTLAGTSAYTGTTTISAPATLEAGAVNALAPTSHFIVTGTLNLNGYNNTIGSLSGAGSVVLGSGILSVANGNGLTFSGDISNVPSGGFSLLSGTLTVTGSNTYTGPTLISNATLIVGSGCTEPLGENSAITITNNGTLQFGTLTDPISNLGAITNNANIIANMTDAGLSDTTVLSIGGYTQGSTANLTLTVADAPGSMFEAFNSSGAISLNGALTVNPSSVMFTSPVILFQGPANRLSGTFSSKTIPANTILQYDYAAGTVFLHGGDPSSSCLGIWAFPGTSNWFTLEDWLGVDFGPSSCIPGSSSMQLTDVAILPDLVGSNATSIYLATQSGGGYGQNAYLYNLDLTAETTSYSIYPDFIGMSDTLSAIELGAISSDVPLSAINVNGGSHTIYAPILLNSDARISLGANLTLGEASTIYDGSGLNTLYISEGNLSGTLTNKGTIGVNEIIIQGGTIINQSMIGYNSDTMTASNLTIQALSGNDSPLIVTNTGTLTSIDLIIDGTDGTTTINNQGTTRSDGGSLSITSAMINNTSGGLIYADSGFTLTLTDAQITNDSTSRFGATNANLNFVSGTIATEGLVTANNYTQGSGAALQINILNQDVVGNLTVEGTADLGGSLVVNALTGFPTTAPQSAVIVQDANGFASNFASHSFTNFPNGVVPELFFHPTEIILSVVPAAQSHVKAGPAILFSSISQHNSYITRKSSQMRFRLPVANQWHYQTADTSLDEDFYAQNDLIAQTHPETLQKQGQLARKIREEKPKAVSFYAGPTGDFGHVKSVGSDAGLGYSSVGGLAGFDAVISPSQEGRAAGGIGAIVEYRKLWGTVLEDGGSLSVDRVHGSVYSILVPVNLPQLYFECILGFTYTWDKNIRNTGYQNALQAKSNTNEAIFDILGGVEFALDGNIVRAFGENFSITPLFHVQYVNDHIGAYKERGSGIYDLSVPTQIVQALGTSLGSRFDYKFVFPTWTLLFEIDAEWQRQYFNNDRTIFVTPYNFSNIASSSIAVAGPKNGLLFALDLFATCQNGFQFEANSTFQWNSRAYDVFFYLGIGREF